MYPRKVPTAATTGTLPQRPTQNQISPQLVLSISESVTTVAVSVSTRATIAVQLNLANGPHIARNCSKLPEMTRHLLIALQPRRVGAPHLVGMESNHLGYDLVTTRQHNLAKAPSPLPAIHCSFNHVALCAGCVLHAFFVLCIRNSTRRHVGCSRGDQSFQTIDPDLWLSPSATTIY